MSFVQSCRTFLVLACERERKYKLPTHSDCQEHLETLSEIEGQVFIGPVLRTMKINDDFEVVLPSPLDGLFEVRELTCNVRFPARDLKRPVSDGNAHMIEP